MLIDSPRLTEADRKHWQTCERIDAVNARRSALEAKARRSMDAIAAFANEPCFIGVSWGKDSVTVADMAMRAGVRAPLVCALWPPWDNPESAAVRDAFLAMWPGADYHEVVKTGCGVGDSSDDWSEVECRFGLRRITGIRSQESTTRRLRCKFFGVSSKNTCAPLAWWRTDDVFAYLYARHLPVSACYAMTMGGRLKRDALRIDALGGDRGDWFGRSEWERIYFGDVLAELKDPGC